ncbi:hypothetical protein VP01_3355g3 [Puccinia sorghi]|uniref:Uncharacterized protein n=1 Tax=Puccinia sorghi TaxID=27349 RepID=A0A0L6UX04_9BASI|nr:hypothetical protein VP01_3355g3 [Puccinia sorghi]
MSYKTTRDFRPVDMLEEDSDTTPGHSANPEVSNPDRQTRPSTGNPQAESSTKNPGLTQKPNANPNPPNSLLATTGQTSDNPPPNPSIQPSRPSEPSGSNTSGETDQQPSLGNDNQTQPASQQSNSHSSTPTNTQLTTILNRKSQLAAVSNLLGIFVSHSKLWAKSLHHVSPIKPDFHFQCASCSNAKWIKPISPLANEFLGPTTNNQWYCPDILNFPALQAHSPHPETNLVQFLHQLYSPPASEISTGQKLLPLLLNSWQMIQGLILKHFDGLKNLSSTFGTTDNNPAPNQEIIKWAHSVDVLHNLQNVITDIFMGYIIIQTNPLSPTPHQRQKEENLLKKKFLFLPEQQLLSSSHPARQHTQPARKHNSENCLN